MFFKSYNIKSRQVHQILILYNLAKRVSMIQSIIIILAQKNDLEI